MTKEIKYPFLKEDGSFVSYTRVKQGDDSRGVEWRDNFEFEDTLIYKGYAGGRSAMTMTFISARTGKEYPMFFCYFNWLISHPFTNGIVVGSPKLAFKGNWTFCKRGQNYSVKPVTE